MNRTRLAQLTAVLGAAVLLVLAVAVTRPGTGFDSTTIAGPPLEQIATQAPGEEPPGGDAQEPGAGDDTPVMGPTAAAPADPVAPDGNEPSPGTAAPEDDADTATGPIGPAAGEGPLPRVSDDPFAPGAATTSPPPAEDPVSGPASGTTGEPTTPPPPAESTPTESTTTESTTTEPTTPAPTGTTAPDGAEGAPPGDGDPALEGATSDTSAPSPIPTPRPEVHTPHHRVHQVVPGDNLWDIVEAALGARASDAQVAVAVDELYELNREVIGDDPDLIFPGQVLELPAW